MVSGSLNIAKVCVARLRRALMSRNKWQWRSAQGELFNRDQETSLPTSPSSAAGCQVAMPAASATQTAGVSLCDDRYYSHRATPPLAFGSWLDPRSAPNTLT